MKEVFIDCAHESHYWSNVDRETAAQVVERARQVVPWRAGGWVLGCQFCGRFSVRLYADKDTSAAALRPVLLVF